MGALLALVGVVLVGCRDDGGNAQSGRSIPLVEVGEGIAKAGAGLWGAAQAGDLAAVRRALVEGADVAARNGDGLTPLMLAAEAGQEEVVALLLEHCETGLDEALFLAARHGHAPIVDRLASHGASVHACTARGQTPLMVAASHGAGAVVRTLLQHGANRYATDARDYTAGQLAMMAGHLEIGRALLARPDPEEFALSSPGDSAKATGILLARPFVPHRICDMVATRAGVAGESAPVLLGADPGSGDDGMRPSENLPVLPLVMREFHQRWFPFKIETVRGESILLRFLYGANRRVRVQQGDTIPGTRLKIVAASESVRQDDTPGAGVVELEDPRTGVRRRILVGGAAVAGAPYAVLEAENGRMIARPGKIVQTSAGNHYRVVDVHPTRVVFENAQTGQFATVPLGER